ncbi:DNA polymerase III subunit alpha [Buchnera aphidicola (Eriosoma lanigerum)]|uniref:DNA polymerase III subunit alpha n=1 Tax=Buchnera aphidicola TaxID=9 RepID=UPI003464A6B8
MYKPRFIHLRVHSDYSLIHGISKPEELIKYVSGLGFPSVALTDFNNLHGVIKFYQAACNSGVKPIIGIDIHLKSMVVPDKLTKLTLLATNNQGYSNLIILITKAYKKGYSDSISSVFVEQDWLIQYRNGLIVLSGGIYGDLGISLIAGKKKIISDVLSIYKNYFPDNYYIELTRTNRVNEELYIHRAKLIASMERIPLVVTNDVCFLHKRDFYNHKIRTAIQHGIPIDNVYLSQLYTCEQYLKTEDEMYKLFIDIPQALMNTVEIAKRCNVTIRLGEYFLPNFPTKNIKIEEFLIIKSKEGLEKRLEYIYPDINIRCKKRKKYDDRLNEELDVINKMGFPGYFLIVMEFVKWSKDNSIPVGPGRGSGAGSLVAYALRITELDPLFFNLLFERFLNPERISLPDLDIDFCINQRDKVIEHVSNRYGSDAVSQIITFGTMTAKAVIKDVGRVLGYPYGFLNKISHLIPLDPGMTLNKALLVCSELTDLYQTNSDVKILINIARKLEGVTRNISKHAGGVVISPTKITDFSPLYYDNKGENPITQFDKNDIEYVGLLKFDFLGLRTLTIIDSTVKMINNSTKNLKNQKLININLIDLNDSKCFHVLQKAETTGIFQLESKGMKDLIKRLKPDTFEDIISLVALFRPGPLKSGMVDNFINRKHGLEKIYYPDKNWQHALLKPILNSTYGIILYQEQVMKIAQVLSGYTLGRADILRRAMGKKNPIEMSKQRFIFQEGSKKNGIDSNLSIKIFDLLEKFAGYGFNKSHSAAYALISYQTLWLKTYYPEEFLASAMNTEIDNIDKLVILIHEVLRLDIKLLSPNINYSKFHFFVNNKKEIVYGLGAIKGISKNVILSIIQSRDNKGIFRDIFDLCVRIDTKQLTSKIILKLIKSGSLDVFKINRDTLVHYLDNIIKAANQYVIEFNNRQQTMFGNFNNIFQNIMNKSVKNSILWSEKQKLYFEKETLGCYLTGHPINEYLYELLYYTKGFRIQDVFSITYNKTVCIVFGIVGYIKKKVSKNSNSYLILQLEDRSKKIEVIVFSQLINQYQDILVKDEILIIKGHVVIDPISKNYKIIAKNIMNLHSARERYVKKIVIVLDLKKKSNSILDELCIILQKYIGGTVPIYVSYSQNITIYDKCLLGVQWNVIPSDNLLYDVRNIIGIKYVKLMF